MIDDNSTESTLNDIINFLSEQPGSRPKSIAEGVGVSRQYVQKLLARNSDLFSVAGSGPNRFYKLNTNATDKILVELKGKDQNYANYSLIEKHFYSLTPLGEELKGLSGFATWCEARGYDFNTKTQEYINILKKYYPSNFKSPIDFTAKLKSTFSDLALKKVWSIDFYNFEVFGKTKLGTSVMIAKQTGDSKITNSILGIADEAVRKIIVKYSINAVAFVSPTIQRQTQLMNILESNLAVDTPRVKIFKVGARILIAQKTLKSLNDRILNAEQTFVAESSVKYDSVLIIDDALGSGATLNEIAKQIIHKKIAKNCYGLVLVGSPSGYEVINEV